MLLSHSIDGQPAIENSLNEKIKALEEKNNMLQKENDELRKKMPKKRPSDDYYKYNVVTLH